MNYLNLLMVLVFATSTGCHQSTNKKSSPSNISAFHEHDEESIISLNGDAKWKVAPAMLIIIRKMENDIQSFDQEEYTEITEKLEANIDELTSNCTMEGQAHDELHKWLLPYIDLVEELSKAKNNTAARSIFVKIEQSFIIFNQFFE